MTYTVGDKEYEDWTEAQDEAVRLLDDGVEYVKIMLDVGLLQELNLERGIEPKLNFNTHVLKIHCVLNFVFALYLIFLNKVKS